MTDRLRKLAQDIADEIYTPNDLGMVDSIYAVLSRSLEETPEPREADGLVKASRALVSVMVCSAIVFSRDLKVASAVDAVLVAAMRAEGRSVEADVLAAECSKRLAALPTPEAPK